MNPSIDEEARTREAFRCFYTDTNLRRLRWVLRALALNAAMSFLFYDRFARLNLTEGPRPSYLVSLAACLAVGGLVEWALRRATPRGRERSACAYYVFGCVYAAAMIWQSHSVGYYALSLLAFSTVLILPPRLAIPLLAAGHVLAVAVLHSFLPHPDVFWANVIFGTFVIVFAAFVSAILHNATWESFRKERTILRQVEELETANREMGDLMAIAAHDLGSPLQGLANLLELVRLQSASGADRTRLDAALEAASLSCTEMIALVRRFLEAHAAEHAGGGAEPIEADLVPHFVAAAKRASPLADAKGTALVIQLPPSKSLVGRTQPHLLGEVLDNLLSNAVKYAPGGTTVTLALSGEAGGACRGEIRDEGPGVAEPERPRLFSKFFNGTNRPTGGEPSTGLGLFIVRKLMDGMGGRAGYEPGLPKGSVFWIEVPGTAERGA